MLVTGAAGMLGRDLVPYLGGRGHAVTAVDLDVDVADPGQVDACVAACRPEAILHLAAYTDVDGAEADEDEARRVNSGGARVVAAAARRARAALVVLSTDYVFDGRSARDYAEDDAPAPLNAYGRTKLAGERAAMAEWPEGTRVARTAWLYGPHGRNFVDTMRALGAERDEVAVVADQVGSPTWTRDLCPALEALVDRPPGVWHVAGAGAASWADLAAAVFAEAGLDCAVRCIGTAEARRPAPRPPRSVLTATRPGAPRLRPWRAALRDHLALGLPR